MCVTLFYIKTEHLHCAMTTEVRKPHKYIKCKQGWKNMIATFPCSMHKIITASFCYAVSLTRERAYEHNHYEWSMEIYLCSFTGQYVTRKYCSLREHKVNKSLQAVSVLTAEHIFCKVLQLRYKDAVVQARKYSSKQLYAAWRTLQQFMYTCIRCVIYNSSYK